MVSTHATKNMIKRQGHIYVTFEESWLKRLGDPPSFSRLYGESGRTVFQRGGLYQRVAAGQFIPKLLDEVVLFRNLLPDFRQSLQGLLMLLNHARRSVDANLRVIPFILRVLGRLKIMSWLCLTSSSQPQILTSC